MPADYKYLVATVDGEAEGESTKCRQAVASAIVNRVVTNYFSNGTFYSTVSSPYQYSSYKGPLYTKCMKYLNKRTGKNRTYEAIIKTSLKVGYRIVPDCTDGAVLFYSPKSMPEGKKPNWDFTKLKEVTIKNVNKNVFRFYKLR